MKHIFFILIISFITGCADTSLKPADAEAMIRERLSKMPGRSVSFYLGAMTDASYYPVYKAIATGKYLTLKDDVYVEAAGRKMPMFEATEEGKKLFQCEKNRCTVEVCKIVFEGLEGIVNKGKYANAAYKVKTVCSGEVYTIFKPLADRLFIKEETVSEKADFELNDNIWKIK